MVGAAAVACQEPRDVPGADVGEDKAEGGGAEGGSAEGGSCDGGSCDGGSCGDGGWPGCAPPWFIAGQNQA